MYKNALCDVFKRIKVFLCRLGRSVSHRKGNVNNDNLKNIIATKKKKQIKMMIPIFKLQFYNYRNL